MWRWCFAIESSVIKSVQPLNSNIIKTNIDPRLWDVHTQIGVSVKDGVVTLSGTVDTYSKKIAAEKAA